MRHQWADEQGVKPEANSGRALAHQHLREPGPVRNHDHVRDPGGGAGTAASRRAAIASKSVRRIMPQCGRVEMGSSGHIVKHLAGKRTWLWTIELLVSTGRRLECPVTPAG